LGRTVVDRLPARAAWRIYGAAEPKPREEFVILVAPICSRGKTRTDIPRCMRLVVCKGETHREMRVGHAPRTVVVTGARAGLGRALALEYAGAGRTLALTGRNRSRLEETADAARGRGADVQTFVGDFCEGTAGYDFIRTFAAAHPIDLLIVNAGVFSGHHA